MSQQIVVVGLQVQASAADQITLGPGTNGSATLNGRAIVSLAHLPGGLAAIECSDQLVIMPWTLFNLLLNRAAGRSNGDT